MSHLTLDDRIAIQECLDVGMSVAAIAKRLKKAPSTIMREIQKHKVFKQRRIPNIKPPCLYRKSCNEYHVCNDLGCRTLCRTCDLCKDHCSKYTPAECERLKKSPHVCNGCLKSTSCNLDLAVYMATYAQNTYKECLSSSREGISMDPELLQKMDNLVSPLIKKGQSIYHILNSHKDEIPCSKNTLYNYVNNGVLTARNIDLHRKVKYKNRKTNYNKISQEIKMEILTRNYQRFLKYTKAHPDLQVVEMDTVIGTSTSKKALLTLLFRSCNLMLIILLENKTQECVIDALNDLSDALGIETFQKLFPIILTDRGTEFTFPAAIECDRNGEIKTKLFFCDAQASWQKGQIERNHEFIRYVLPKGTSFDRYTQEDINLLMNHINSYSRKQLNGATPYQLSKLVLDNRIHSVLNLVEIAPDDVCLKPYLLSKSKNND